MKLSDLINLLEATKIEKGDMEIRLCELMPDEEYLPLFTDLRIASSKEFTDEEIPLTFLKEDICKDKREFLFFDCASKKTYN